MARKKSALRTPELSRLAGIVNTSRDAIYSINLQGNVVTWNKGSEKLFGYTAEEVIGKSLQTLTVPQGKYSEVKKVLSLIGKKRDIPSFETERKTKNGALIHVLFSVSYLTNDMGKVTGASVIARNVTEQRQAILELEQANTILYHIIQNTPDVICVKDISGRYLMLNNAASTYLGGTTLTLLGKKDEDIMPKDMAKKIREHDEKVIASKKPLQMEEEFLVHGEKRTLLATKVPYFDTNKKLIGIIAVSKDISDIKNKQKDRDDMLAIVSHELKNPLTSISLYSHELQRSLQSPKNVNYAKKIVTHTKRLNSFIHELLDLARLESRTFDLHYEKFLLSEILEEVIESIHDEYPTHQIEVQGSYPKKLYADKFRLSQILTNLLTNAIKYSPHANRVLITISATDSELLLCIQDFGIGIPKKHQEHIFDKYFRVKNKNTPGTGLGLHIVAEIVKLHGGKIWVESKKNNGSTFFVSLPHKKYTQQVRKQS
jgi:two-component system CheB/CheR fusion protein